MAVVPYKWIFRLHLDDLIRLAGEPTTVLEAGCALGKFSERFPQARYVGTTFSEPDLVAARELLPDREFLMADLGQQGSLPPETFDLVICTHTISYVPSERLEVAVQNLRLATSSDGHAIVEFTADELGVLLPLLRRHFTILDHRRYGGRLLERASRAGMRLGASDRESIRGAFIRALNRIDVGRQFHIVLLRPLGPGGTAS
jgi:SAM-dependent methyltransferase